MKLSHILKQIILHIIHKRILDLIRWNTAVQFIKKKIDYDYLWIMDDDGYKYALDKLMNFIS